MKKRVILILLVSALLCGCTVVPAQPAESDASAQISQPSESLADISSLFSDRDLEGSYEDGTLIQLNGNSVSCTDSAVDISGTTVTIRKEGTYLIRGTLDDGVIIVDTDKESKVQLVLSGVSIHSGSCAPIYVVQADKVFITLADGTENTLSNGGSFESSDENSIDAVVFSKEDLTINGGGSLTVLSPAGHGIVSKDELTITGGSFSLTAASHGLTGKDSICISAGNFLIDSGKDGIHAENNDDESLGFVYIGGGSFTITAEGDGISASSIMQLDGGTYDIITGGGSVNGEQHTSEDWGGFGGFGPGGGPGSGRRGGFGSDPGQSTTTEDSTSIKGIKASGNLLINGGTYTLDTADDAIHSNSNVTVNGGLFTISTGDDGIHADEALTIRSGTIAVSESYEGLEGLSIEISGGEITLVSSDDGLNAAGGNDMSGFGGHRGGDMFGASSDSFITISGGNIFMDASGDGIDSNGNLTITGGEIIVEGPTSGGNGSLDYGGTAQISGGTLVVIGSIQMAQSVGSSGNQGVLALSTGNMAAGSAITVSGSAGNAILTYTPGKTFACVILSSPEILRGETYTITIGTASGTFEAG